MTLMDITPGPIWNDQPWPRLPQLKANLTVDVCVVGLGSSGLAALTELQQLGINTVGIDAGAVGAGAAGHNGGFLLAGLSKFFHQTVQQFGSDTASAIYQHTVDEIKRQARDMPDIVRLTGSLRIAGTPEELSDCESHLRALIANGFKAKWYEGPEGNGILLPSDGVVQPVRRVRLLARRLTKAGIPLYENSPVIAVEPGGVITATGNIRCNSVIVAVDGRLEALLPQLKPRVRSARLQMLATAPTPAMSFSRPVYRRWGYDYWQQLPDKSVVLGGFRDQAEAAEWTHSTKPSAKVQSLLDDYLRHQLKVTAPVTHRWAASVSYTTDGLPICEELQPGIWAVGAYNGVGNIVGMLCGRAAAQLATGRQSQWAQLLHRARQHSNRA